MAYDDRAAIIQEQSLHDRCREREKERERERERERAASTSIYPLGFETLHGVLSWRRREVALAAATLAAVV